MLDMTAEESAALRSMKEAEVEKNKLEAALKDLQRKRDFTGIESPARVTFDQEIVALAERLSMLKTEIKQEMESPIYPRAEVKQALRDSFEKKLGPIDQVPHLVAAFVSVFEEVSVGAMTAEETGRLMILAKQAIIMFSAFVNDPDLHKSRAAGLKLRYDALLAAGFDEQFVKSLLLAEAARPYPSIHVGK